jgi:hypothetical protein
MLTPRMRARFASRMVGALAVPALVTVGAIAATSEVKAVEPAAAVDGRAADVAGLPISPDAHEGRAAGEPATIETRSPDARVRVVAVKVVADRAYRNRFPNWRQRVKDMVERADNRLATVYGIDLTVTSTAWWRPGEQGPRCSSWLDRLTGVDRSGADFVIGVTRNGYTDLGGCAKFLGRYLTIKRQDDRMDWIAVRHEVSHLYGARDRYLCNPRCVPGSNPNHRDDLMEDPYDHPHWWSNEPGDGDRRIIRRHSERFN